MNAIPFKTADWTLNATAHAVAVRARLNSINLTRLDNGLPLAYDIAAGVTINAQ